MRVQFRNGIQHDYRDTCQDHQDQDDVEPFPRGVCCRFDMSLLSFAARALVVSLY
jgi:hypothetical protein